MKILILISAVGFAQLCNAQSLRTIDVGELERMMADKNVPIHIFNFWATWCAPCVAELPYFDRLTTEGRPGVKVTLVSMDLDLDPDPTKVHRFVARKGIRSPVVLLDAKDPNGYIDRIDQEWSGALPATLILNHKTGKRTLLQRALRSGELETLLDDGE